MGFKWYLLVHYIAWEALFIAVLPLEFLFYR